MAKWFVHTKKADFKAIAEKFGIDQVTARIIRNRGIIGDEAVDRYLNGKPEDLYDPFLLKDARRAAAILLEKIAGGKKIRVIGDYDIDGVCATFIICDMLRRLGGDCDYDVPDRAADGFGLGERLVQVSYSAGVDTIITCDNGISAAPAVKLAKSLGMTVIVTDHHQPPKELPEADVLVDPHLASDTAPFKEICGAVVAWKVMQVLGALAAPDDPDSGAAEVRDRYLDLAAFATIGDVMDLQDENRIIVKWGLKALEKTANTGMQALIRRCGLEGGPLSAYHAGFILGPCINAGGRLMTAHTALRLLFEKDAEKAAGLADELAVLNEERKSMTQLWLETAMEQIDSSAWSEDPVYVIYLSGCHESIAGIVAGKVRERVYHPVIVFTDTAEAGVLKGSGRSIPAWNMIEALDGCSDLLLKYGGHPMAAGLTISKNSLDALRLRLNEDCDLTEEDLVEKVMIDVPMPVSYINERLIEELNVLEPCGKGNEKPVFAEKDLKVLTARILGANRNTIKFTVENSGGTWIEALYFGEISELLAYLEMKYSPEAVDLMMRGKRSGICISVLYYPSVNEYRGRRSLQIIIKDYC